MAKAHLKISKHHIPMGIYLKNDQRKIAQHQNSSKIQSENHRNRGKIDTPNTHIHDHSLS